MTTKENCPLATTNSNHVIAITISFELSTSINITTIKYFNNMANFRHLEIAPQVASHPNIYIKKSFLGFKTRVFYQPTYSEVDSVRKYFTMSSGSDICDFLRCCAKGECSHLPEHLSIEYNDNGNYCLEMCSARDGQFVALQMFKYINLEYQPVCDIIIYEGNEAKNLKKAIECGEVTPNTSSTKPCIYFSQVEEL